MKPDTFKKKNVVFVTSSNESDALRNTVNTLRSQDFIVLCPQTMPELLNDTEDVLVSKADIILFVGDWKASEATRKQYKIATAENKMIMFGLYELERYMRSGD